MTRDSITTLPDPNGFSADPLTDLIRKGARQLIEQALEAELSALLAQCQRRSKNPQKCRSKNPQFCGFGCQPISVTCGSIFGWTASSLWCGWWCDGCVGARVFGDEV